jgi:hypothetical protein
MKMSTKDELLKHLSLVGSETMPNHHQRPTEKNNSCITLPLKAGGRALDNSDCFIEELIKIQPKETLLNNGTVENCGSESVLKTTEAVSLNSTESSCRNGHKVELLSVAFLDASCSTSHDTHLQSASLDLHSSSEPVQSSQASDTSSNKLEAPNLQNASNALNGIAQPSPSTESSDTVTPTGLAPPDPNPTSQSMSSVPTHTRNFSQSTHQLTNLKENAKSDNLEDTSLVSNLLQGSNINKLPDSYPLNKSETVYLKNMQGVSQNSSSNEVELLALQDVKSSTGHDMAPDNQDVKEETAFECSSSSSQCSGTVSYLSSLDSDVQSLHLTHSFYPDWKLDRRESGHLFWRRDSSTLDGVDPSSRVKFRYHIEVREFESRSSEAEDLSEGDDDDMYDDNDDDEEEVQETGKYSISDSLTFVGKRDESSLGSAAVIGGVAIIAIIVMASYRWLLGALSVI